MLSQSLNQFFILYMWFPLAATLGVLTLIARFYQKFSDEKTYFPFFGLPIVFFGIASVRYASIESMAGDPIADVLFGLGGIILVVLSVRLYWIMVFRKKPDEAE